MDGPLVAIVSTLKNIEQGQKKFIHCQNISELADGIGIRGRP